MLRAWNVGTSEWIDWTGEIAGAEVLVEACDLYLSVVVIGMWIYMWHLRWISKFQRREKDRSILTHVHRIGGRYV